MQIQHFVLDFWRQNSIPMHSFNQLVRKKNELLLLNLILFKASKSIGSTDLSNMKRRMYLISSEAKTDLKQSVYRNHTKFIETAKQVSSLESEVYQLHTLLADERQLLSTVKELLNIENKVRINGKSINILTLCF
jgi:hypothetical protein